MADPNEEEESSEKSLQEEWNEYHIMPVSPRRATRRGIMHQQRYADLKTATMMGERPTRTPKKVIKRKNTSGTNNKQGIQNINKQQQIMPLPLSRINDMTQYSSTRNVRALMKKEVSQLRKQHNLSLTTEISKDFSSNSTNNDQDILEHDGSNSSSSSGSSKCGCDGGKKDKSRKKNKETNCSQRENANDEPHKEYVKNVMNDSQKNEKNTSLMKDDVNLVEKNDNVNSNQVQSKICDSKEDSKNKSSISKLKQSDDLLSRDTNASNDEDIESKKCVVIKINISDNSDNDDCLVDDNASYSNRSAKIDNLGNHKQKKKEQTIEKMKKVIVHVKNICVSPKPEKKEKHLMKDDTIGKKIPCIRPDDTTLQKYDSTTTKDNTHCDKNVNDNNNNNKKSKESLLQHKGSNKSKCVSNSNGDKRRRAPRQNTTRTSPHSPIGNSSRRKMQTSPVVKKPTVLHEKSKNDDENSKHSKITPNSPSRKEKERDVHRHQNKEGKNNGKSLKNCHNKCDEKQRPKVRNISPKRNNKRKIRQSSPNGPKNINEQIRNAPKNIVDEIPILPFMKDVYIHPTNQGVNKSGKSSKKDDCVVKNNTQSLANTKNSYPVKKSNKASIDNVRVQQQHSSIKGKNQNDEQQIALSGSINASPKNNASSTSKEINNHHVRFHDNDHYEIGTLKKLDIIDKTKLMSLCSRSLCEISLAGEKEYDDKSRQRQQQRERLRQQQEHQEQQQEQDQEQPPSNRKCKTTSKQNIDDKIEQWKAKKGGQPEKSDGSCRSMVTTVIKQVQSHDNWEKFANEIDQRVTETDSSSVKLCVKDRLEIMQARLAEKHNAKLRKLEDLNCKKKKKGMQNCNDSDNDKRHLLLTRCNSNITELYSSIITTPDNIEKNNYNTNNYDYLSNNSNIVQGIRKPQHNSLKRSISDFFHDITDHS